MKVPYDAKVTLKCVSPTAKLLTFINTTLDLDQNLWNGLSPDMSPNQFLSQNSYKTTSTKHRPKIIHDKMQQTKLKDHYLRLDSTLSRQQQTDPGINDRNYVTKLLLRLLH